MATYSHHIFNRHFLTEFFGELGLVMTSMFMIFFYTNIVLGNCSPIYFRSVSTIVGLFCVILSTTSGYGLAFTFGQLISLAHNVLPFMIIGIGVDDMFVIVNCID